MIKNPCISGGNSVLIIPGSIGPRVFISVVREANTGGGDTIVNMNVTATTQADWNDIAGQAARQLRLMKAGA